MTHALQHSSKPRRHLSRRAEAGFTLTELMVAITGGLFVSIIVFSISKNSARFYQSETRVGEATLGGIVGFERLRADVARAGFLSTPNILEDRDVCGGPPGVPFPGLLATLSAVQVTQNATELPNNANLNQDSILLAGSYGSADYFAMRSFQQVGNTFAITLDPASGAMVRLGYDAGAGAGAAAAVLGSVFAAGRAVRILDRTDKQYYGIIDSINVTIPTEPTIILAATPAIQLQGQNRLCGIDQCTGCVVNVVNFIRYDVSRVQGDGYGPLYDAGGAPYDDTRVELRRVELDPATGQMLAGTNEELVTQYAVDLKFGLIVDDRAIGQQPAIRMIPPADDEVDGWTQWHRVRGLRVRLSVRTRDADREVDIVPGDLGLSPGLYRVGLGADGQGPFARVRTLQADVMLNNTVGFKW